MPYDPMKELKRVTDYYNQDPLQKRFSAIVTGETNAGKTYLLRSARFPIHIESFDPGGTKCLTDLVRSKENPNGQIVVDSSWETEDPFNPTAYAEWMKVTNIRLTTGYFNMFGTYALDGLTTFGKAVMNFQLASDDRAGEVPKFNWDYNPQRNNIENYIRKLMNISCDFIVMGHLREIEKLLAVDNKGIKRTEIKYRLHVTGQSVITIPLLFDELYTIIGKGNPPKREMLIDSLGTYIARSRLKRNGKLDASEEPDIRKILKKAGFASEDKPKLAM